MNASSKRSRKEYQFPFKNSPLTALSAYFRCIATRPCSLSHNQPINLTGTKRVLKGGQTSRRQVICTFDRGVK